MRPERRSFATVAVCCVLGAATLAAIGVALAVAYGAFGQLELAAAVGILGMVQLSILIGNWRRSAPVAVQMPDYSGRSALSVITQDRFGSDGRGSREEPQMTDMMSPVVDAEEASETAVSATDEPGEAASMDAGSLDAGQLDLHLEPVVELDATRTVYYRASLALTRKDGSLVGSHLLSLGAAGDGFAPALDLALFRRVCPVIRHLKARSRRPGVFCPLSPQAFAERDVLDELVQFLRANEDAAGAMVIEISQSDLAALSPAGMDGLAWLAELGATLSLREARLEGPDPATLALLGFRFFDLDVAALARIHGWEAFDEDGDVRGLARRAEEAGLTVIAANVARAEELEHVRPFARLARGSLFSPPRIVRRDIADQPDQAAAA